MKHACSYYKRHSNITLNTLPNSAGKLISNLVWSCNSIMADYYNQSFITIKIWHLDPQQYSPLDIKRQCNYLALQINGVV